MPESDETSKKSRSKKKPLPSPIPVEEEAPREEEEEETHEVTTSQPTAEMSASFKNFRHHPDMENFYRFIYENDLRHEALGIIDELIAEKLAKKGTAKKH